MGLTYLLGLEIADLKKENELFTFPLKLKNNIPWVNFSEFFFN